MTHKTLAQCLLSATSILFPTVAHADSMILSSQSGSSYAYDLYAPDGDLSFDAGNTVTLSGLSDVTGVTLSDPGTYFGTVSYTDSTVTFTLNQAGSYNPGSPIDVNLFTVTSGASSMDNITYALQQTDGTETGTVQTGTEVTPEPSTLLLLSTGTAATGFLRRRRRSAQQCGDAGDAASAEAVPA